MSPDGGLEVLGTLCDTAGVSFNLNWLEEFTSNKRKVNHNSQKRNAHSSTKPTASWLYEKGLFRRPAKTSTVSILPVTPADRKSAAWFRQMPSA